MISVTSSDALSGVTKGKAAVLFQAHWCPFCRRFAPLFARALAGHDELTAVEAILDDEENPLWEEYGIEVVPTVLFLEGGLVTARLDGRPGVGLRESDLAQALAKG